MGAEPVSREQTLSILLHTLHTMLLCCCWPVHKCVTVLSCFDTLIVTIFAYKSFNVLTDTIHDPHWSTIFSFLFFLCFAACQLIATIFIILAHKRNIAHYCYPRLVLITGLIVCSAIACIVMLIYFGGAQSSMNNFFFRMYEYFFEKVDDIEKAELKSELKLYAAGFLALALTFCIYSIFELFLTRKFYQSLDEFTPVPQNDPSAPQPAFNPDFAQTPGKVYPDLP
ncbi:hypothetical protein ANCCAN_16415 [Ancylostoma caninum]|uniref:Uncharacterized protein n=2 Tax=Ancylostoma caninum TaxID=29170 RepID=A0A368G3V4_ANCCA|nr:hypothetical protein ANCCAN_16415 [Ancylostoma caninum]